MTRTCRSCKHFEFRIPSNRALIALPWCQYHGHDCQRRTFRPCDRFELCGKKALVEPVTRKQTPVELL